MTKKPITPLEGIKKAQVKLPGSKSITNRALILAALSDSFVQIENAAICDDTQAMVNALDALGFHVQYDPSCASISIQGKNGKIPAKSAQVNCLSAGTVGRFITALTAIQEGGDYLINGSPQLRKRPIKPLIDSLVTLGLAHVTYKDFEGYMPFSIKGLGGKYVNELEVDCSQSSQFISALLMISPYFYSKVDFNASGSSSISRPYIEMTLKMMRQFGYASPVLEGETIKITNLSLPAYRPNFQHYLVESDASALSYFLALSFTTGTTIEIDNAPNPENSLQGDIKFLQVMEELGVQCIHEQGKITISCTRPAQASGLQVDLSHMPDVFMTLAALSPLHNGPTRITGISHTTIKESNRIEAMAHNLRNLGQGVEIGPDWIEIAPAPLNPAIIETFDDHRIAMAFSILGCHDLHRNGQSWLTIKNPDCCAKSFPNFFDVLESINK